MIDISDITKKYDDIYALNNVSMEIEDGKIVVLLGSSGSGKSTLLRLINRIIEPTSGNIFIDGKDIKDYKVENLRRNIGYAVQSTALFPHLNVYENIAIVPNLLKWDKKKINERVDYLLDLVGLDPNQYKYKKSRELSGGEAQRIGVARALSADPPILLMDEPFGALDPINRKRLQIEFLKIQSQLKKTVVFVTHDVEEAIILGDKIAILSKGCIEGYKTPEEFIKEDENEFIKDFLGSEYAIKLLSKFSASDILEKDYLQRGLESNDDKNLQILLADMIRTGKDKIEISNGVEISISDILSLFSRNMVYANER